MKAYIVMAERNGIQVVVIGYTEQHLAEEFINRHQGKKGMKLFLRIEPR